MAYPYCLEVFPWFEAQGEDAANELTGIDGGIQGGAFGKRGCGVSCYPCSNDDGVDFAGSVGSHAHGSRFLRPHDLSESRSASGRYDWPSGDARVLFIPWQAGFYQLSMCYRQGVNSSGEHAPLAGTEKWDRNICNCLPEFEHPGPGSCVPPFGDCIVPRKFAVTVFVHTSDRWPPTNEQISCTGQSAFGQARTFLRFVPFRGGSPFILRLAHSIAPGIGGRPSGGCAVHLNAMCSGVQEFSSACQLQFGAGGPQPLHGVGGGAIKNWDRLDIREYKASFRTGFGEPESQQAILEAKNRILIWMNQRQADMPWRLANTNSPDPDDPHACDDAHPVAQNIDRPTREVQHDYWKSEWNGLAGPLCSSPQPLHVIAETYATEMDGGTGDGGLQWDNCYLRRSGQRVRVQYVPLQIVVEVVAQWLNWKQDKPCQNSTPLSRGQIFPQIRVIIDVQMGVYAKFLADDGTTNLAEHTLQTIVGETAYNIFNDETRGDAGRDWNGAGRYPEVRRIGVAAPDGLIDEIVFVDNGGRVIDGPPPDHWQWIGEMNLHRDKTKLFDQEWVDGQANATGCCGLHRRMANGLAVHAAYTDPIWPETYHGSGVSMPRALITVPDQPGQAPRDAQIIERFRTGQATGYVVIASDCWNEQGVGCGPCDSTGILPENPGEPCGGPGEPPCV